MADLNALIAQGAQFQPLPDPFAQYGKMQQLQNASMQNQLTQQQLASAKLTYDQAKGAQDFIAGIMTKAQENGSNVTDPFAAAKQMLNHPNPAVQAVGTHLLDAHQKVRAFEQQQAWEAANAPGPGATGGTFAPGAVPMPSKLTAPVDLPPLSDGAAPSNALAPAVAAPVAPVANAFVKPGAVTPESVAAQIKKGDMLYGAAPGWKADRELLVKQYEAVLNPRQRAIGAVNAADYTPASIAAFNTSGNYADLVPKAVKEAKTIGNVNPSDFTAASVAKFNTTGNYADLVAAPPKPGTVVNIDQKQQGSFAAGLGTGQSKRILDSQAGAQDAADILATNEVGRSLLKSGAITGAGADFFVGLNKALKQGGIDFGYADAAANSQAYGAAMAANTGKLIKQFGAGTAISDADREYATKAAAGQITMDEAAIRKVLDINDRAARNVIQRHNKLVKGVQTNLPLEVEIPTAAPPPPSGASLIPGSTPAAGGGATVTLPDGRIKTFPNAAAANQFKKAAGL